MGSVRMNWDADDWLVYADDDNTIQFLCAEIEDPTSFMHVPGLYKFARPKGDPSMITSLRVKGGDIFVHLDGARDKKWDLNDRGKGYISVRLTLNKSLSVVAKQEQLNRSLRYSMSHLQDRLSAAGVASWKDYINCRQYEIWTEEGSAKHMRDEHGLAEGDCDNWPKVRQGFLFCGLVHESNTPFPARKSGRIDQMCSLRLPSGGFFRTICRDRDLIFRINPTCY